MKDISILEKLRILLSAILTSDLFLILAIFIGICFVLIFIDYIKDKKLSKWIYVICWLVAVILILTRYHSFVFSLVDNFFDTFFMALYFPNLSTYVIVLVISNSFLVLSLIKRNMFKFSKILNITSAIIINIFLVLVIDIVSKNNINVYEELTVYSNSKLLVLLELSMAIFTSWVLLSLLARAYRKLKLKDLPEMEAIIYDNN